MPPKFWAYGIALYALNLEVSLNISASFEGWYVDHLSWHWIFWQQVPLAVGMALCLKFGTRPDRVNPQRPKPDYFGFASGGIGLALIYAALDQGNRLDWLNSGMIWGLSLAGGLLVAAFFIHEARSSSPAVDFKVLFEAPLPRLLVMIAFLRLTILSTAYVVPQFLQVVRGFRAIEVGETLVWIAAPQFILCYMAGFILRRVDARFVASVGFMFICTACLMVAHTITPVWGSDQFLPSQLLQAVGQSFALSGTIFFGVLHLRPQDALTFASALQVARLMGGEIGTAFVVTFVRKRTQIASNLLGQHLQRRAAYFELAAVLGRPPSKAPAQVESCVLPPRLSDLIPVGDGATLLKRRPDVHQAERRLAAATARIGVATAELYPRIELKGLIGGASSELNEFATNKGITWGVGPAISWAFPNQSGPRARLRQAKANTAAALASFDAVVLQALKETEQALALYRAELDHRQALAEAQDRAQKAFAMAHNQFIAGAVSDLDLLTSEQQLVATDAAVAGSDAALVQDQIAVFKALGGGWHNTVTAASR
jgi:hypothetical protein